MIQLPRSFRGTALATLLASAPATVLAATIVVNSNSDAVANDGLCTLREAIIAANTNAGGSANECAAGQTLPTVDTIAFAIPGSGVHTISPTSSLPIITQAMVIDGYTQTGASANTLAVGDNAVLRIEIDGSGLASGDLFDVSSNGSTFRGLVINRVVSASIFIGFSTFANDNNTIEGNFFGTDPTGSTFMGGTTTVIRLAGSSNVLGGAIPAARNVIVGGGAPFGGAILIGGNANVMQGNYVGINAAGTAPLQPGNATNGIELGTAFPFASNSLIGGSIPGAGNVIFATNVGIVLSSSIHDNVIQGNMIGTDATGSTGLGGSTGISTGGGALNTTIGGAVPGAGNLISGGSTGIFLGSDAPGVIIRGNRIGTDSTGTRAILNSGNGITLSAPAAGSIIGGTNPGEGNTIAFNCGQGVSLDHSATQWAMLGNSIHSNGGLGISLNAAGIPTANDLGDGDTGANNLQNYPVITSAPMSAGVAAISGTLNSVPNTTFRIEFFVGSSCDGSGFGEGRTFIGTTNVTTNANGDAGFGPLSFAVPAGQTQITATATDAVGNTSEFSQCFGPHDNVFANGFEFACAGAESNQLA